MSPPPKGEESDSPQQAGKKEKAIIWSRLTPSQLPFSLLTFSFNPSLSPPHPSPQLPQEGPMPALLPAQHSQHFGRTLFLFRVGIQGETALTAHFVMMSKSRIPGDEEEILPGDGIGGERLPRGLGSEGQPSGPLPWDSSWDPRGAGLGCLRMTPSQSVSLPVSPCLQGMDI